MNAKHNKERGQNNYHSYIKIRYISIMNGIFQSVNNTN